MRIGRLRHQVTLQYISNPNAKDATGAPTPTYTTAGTRQAEVRTLSANEQRRIEIDSVVGTVIHQVTLRKDPVIKPQITWRVVWVDDGVTRTFEVMGVTEPDNRQRIVQLLCVEVLT